MPSIEDYKSDMGLARKFCVVKTMLDWPDYGSPEYSTSIRTVLNYWIYKFHIDFSTIHERRELDDIFRVGGGIDRANEIIQEIWQKIDNRVAEHLREG